MRSRRLNLLVAIVLGLAVSATVNLFSAAPAAADACYTWGRPLSSGMSGSDVFQLQIRIAGWVGYGENLVISGTFDLSTHNALKRFHAGYGITEAGVAGPETYEKLYELQDDDCTPIHFDHSEFNYSCGEQDYTGGAVSEATARENAKRLMWQLEAERHKLGDRPIVVTSGFRSYACNSSLGGPSNSTHLYGQAADLGTASGPTLCELAQRAQWSGFEEILGPGYPGYDAATHVANRSSRLWSVPGCGI